MTEEGLRQRIEKKRIWKQDHMLGGGSWYFKEKNVLTELDETIAEGEELIKNLEDKMVLIHPADESHNDELIGLKVEGDWTPFKEAFRKALDSEEANP